MKNQQHRNLKKKQTKTPEQNKTKKPKVTHLKNKYAQLA